MNYWQVKIFYQETEILEIAIKAKRLAESPLDKASEKQTNAIKKQTMVIKIRKINNKKNKNNIWNRWKMSS